MFTNTIIRCPQNFYESRYCLLLFLLLSLCQWNARQKKWTRERTKLWNEHIDRMAQDRMAKIVSDPKPSEAKRERGRLPNTMEGMLFANVTRRGE